MSERKINLEEIFEQYGVDLSMFDRIRTADGSILTEKDKILKAVMDFGEQLLKLAAENAECKLRNKIEYSNSQLENGFVIGNNAIVINKQSILDTIKQVD